MRTLSPSLRRTVTAVATVLSLIVPLPPAAADTHLRLAWDTSGDRVRFENGWSLTTTTNPMIEVRKPRGGGVIGIVELLSFPLDNRIAAARTADEQREVLRRIVTEHQADIAEDRREGLGSDYRYTPEPLMTVRFGDRRAVRYGAVTRDPEGEVVERQRGYMAVKRGQLWVFAANGYDPELFPSDVIQLTPERQEVLARYLDDLVASSPLPREGSGLIEGIVVGTHGGLRGGRIFVLHNGRKQRIAQPRPMTVKEASRYDGGRRIAELDVRRSATGSFFAVVPPDGPNARLHLVVGGRIHEVVVQHVKADLVEGIDNLRRDVTDRLVVARR
jgi:hypothetical protein